MPLLRKLNSQGVEALKQYLSAISTEPDKPVPTTLLVDPTASEILSVQLEMEMKQFSSRMEAAEYLYGVLSKSEAANLDRDPGIWAWLALLYFDQLCPKGNDGKRKARELARYIPSGHAWRYYRHLLAGPYLIYKAHRDNPSKARIVLYGTLDTITDFTEQLASRQDIVQNKAAIETATLLYLNPQSGRPKRGAADTTHKPGTLRRFTDLINQLDPTFDLYSMNAIQLLAKLPDEFNAFRS
jgi:hypothetical protein